MRRSRAELVAPGSWWPALRSPAGGDAELQEEAAVEGAAGPAHLGDERHGHGAHGRRHVGRRLAAEALEGGPHPAVHVDAVVGVADGRVELGEVLLLLRD